MPGIRRVYIERGLVGWHIVAEASPSATGLHLWATVRKWRLTHDQATRAAETADRHLDEVIAYHRDGLARRARRRQRETLKEQE